MREIGSVADDFDVGGFIEGKYMHTAPHRDAHFGEAGATKDSTAPNLRLPLGYDGFAVLDVVAVFLVSCHDSSFGCFSTDKYTKYI